MLHVIAFHFWKERGLLVSDYELLQLTFHNDADELLFHVPSDQGHFEELLKVENLPNEDLHIPLELIDVKCFENRLVDQLLRLFLLINSHKLGLESEAAIDNFLLPYLVYEPKLPLKAKPEPNFKLDGEEGVIEPSNIPMMPYLIIDYEGLHGLPSLDPHDPSFDEVTVFHQS